MCLIKKWKLRDKSQVNVMSINNLEEETINIYSSIKNDNQSNNI